MLLVHVFYVSFLAYWYIRLIIFWLKDYVIGDTNFILLWTLFFIMLCHDGFLSKIEWPMYVISFFPS